MWANKGSGVILSVLWTVTTCSIIVSGLELRPLDEDVHFTHSVVKPGLDTQSDAARNAVLRNAQGVVIVGRGYAGSVVGAAAGADADEIDSEQEVFKGRPRAHKYGFFMSVTIHSEATKVLLEDLRATYTAERVILFSDRSLDYTNMCNDPLHECLFALGGEKSGPWGVNHSEVIHLQRLDIAMKLCDCDYLIKLEEDGCIHPPIIDPPSKDGDIGGVPWPLFDRSFVKKLSDRTGHTAHQPAVWGCNHGCYMKTDSMRWCLWRHNSSLMDRESADYKWLYSLAGELLSQTDVYPVVASMFCGKTVIPWSEAIQNGMRWSDVRRKLILDLDHIRGKRLRAFAHECGKANAAKKEELAEENSHWVREPSEDEYSQASQAGNVSGYPVDASRARSRSAKVCPPFWSRHGVNVIELSQTCS